MSSLEKALRIDHAQLGIFFRGVIPLGDNEDGWLVLTNSGEVHFYETPNLTADATPKFRASTVEALCAKRAMFGTIRVTFGEQVRFLGFTGMVKPPSAAMDGTGNALAAAGQVAGTALQVGAFVAKGKVVLDNRGFKPRKREARDAWLPILMGDRPWQDLRSDPD